MYRWLELAGVGLKESTAETVKVGLPNQMSEDEIWDIVRDNGIANVESFKIDGSNVTFRLEGEVTSEMTDQFIDFVLAGGAPSTDEFDLGDSVADYSSDDVSIDVDADYDVNGDGDFSNDVDVSPYEFDELSAKLGEGVDINRLKKTFNESYGDERYIPLSFDVKVAVFGSNEIDVSALIEDAINSGVFMDELRTNIEHAVDDTLTSSVIDAETVHDLVEITNVKVGD